MNTPHSTNNSPSQDERAVAGRIARWGSVLWPSFLTAALLNAGVFSLIDPSAIHAPGMHDPLAWSDRTLYTLGFFVAWVCISISTALSVWLLDTARSTRAPQR